MNLIMAPSLGNMTLSLTQACLNFMSLPCYVAAQQTLTQTCLHKKSLLSSIIFFLNDYGMFPCLDSINNRGARLNGLSTTCQPLSEQLHYPFRRTCLQVLIDGLHLLKYVLK